MRDLYSFTEKMLCTLFRTRDNHKSGNFCAEAMPGVIFALYESAYL
jgi:hypothetical protein